MKTSKFALIAFVFALAVLMAVSAPVAAQRPNPVADLAVSGYAKSDPGKSLITYHIEVANLAAVKALHVTVAQTLSSQTRFLSVKTTNGKCTGGPLVLCTVNKLPAGKTMTITVNVSRVRVPCAADCLIPIKSKITVTSASFDPISGNNAYTILTY